VTTALFARYFIPGLNVALLFSFLLTVAMTVAVIPLAKRRPIGTPLSWGEAMVASVYAFFVMFLAYGVVPHQWLTHAGNELNWRADRFVIGPKLGGRHLLEYLPFVVNRQAFQDIIAAGIYIVFFALHIYVWVWWQKRGQKQSGAKELTSSYGRPLVKRG
jgi:hypothetical protein